MIVQISKRISTILYASTSCIVSEKRWIIRWITCWVTLSCDGISIKIKGTLTYTNSLSGGNIIESISICLFRTLRYTNSCRRISKPSRTNCLTNRISRVVPTKRTQSTFQNTLILLRISSIKSVICTRKLAFS